MFRSHKIVKYRYRFVITNSEKVEKKIFSEYSDARAKTKLYAKIHQLPPGGTVTLFRWDSKSNDWEQIGFGGKDKLPVKKTLF